MASILDAIDETRHDSHAFIKIILYTIPVLLTYVLFNIGNMGWFYFVGSLTFLMLVTILVKTINNVRNSKNYVLPTFNLFTFVYSSIKAVIALGPVFGVGIWLGVKLSNIQMPVNIPHFQTIYLIIIWAIISSILLTSLIFYSKTEKISDAYNFNLIQAHCIDILTAIIYFIPQIAIFNIIIVGSVAYLLYVFKQPFDHPILIIACALALVISVPICGNYFAQIDWEQNTDGDRSDFNS